MMQFPTPFVLPPLVLGPPAGSEDMPCHQAPVPEGEDASAHEGHDMSGHEGHDMSSHEGHDMPGEDAPSHEGHDMSGHEGHDMSGHDMSGHDMSGHDMSGHDMSGHDMSGHEMTMVATEDGEAVMVMGGMPPWLFVASIVLVLVLSFVIVERVGSREKAGEGFRFNLLKNPKVYALVKSRWFQFVPQVITVAALVFLIYAGLFGNRIGNITPVAVWTIWWAGLVFAVALLGPVFCAICPWDLLGRFGIRRRLQTLTLGLKVPKALRNMWPAIILFALLTWAELGLGVTTDPRSTAYMAIGMVVLAIAAALVFRKKAFCAHLCPVGRISGMYANFAPIEIRSADPEVCKSCKTQDCLRGNDEGYACPTGLSLRVLNENTMCTMCTECVRSCDQNNVAINLRPFARDLVHKVKIRSDEAWMCVVLLALTLFHGFSMTTAWENFNPGSPSLMKWMATTLGTPNTLNFTLGMIVVIAIPIALFELSCWAAARLTRDSGLGAQKLFRAYSLSLLPVALFYHLAHNLMHLLMEGGSLVPLLSNPLGRGTDHFGTASMQMGHLASETTIWYLQIALILVGHLFGIVIAHRISRRLFEDPKQATRSLIPMLAVMIMISIAGLSLMVLDMNMRVGRM